MYTNNLRPFEFLILDGIITARLSSAPDPQMPWPLRKPAAKRRHDMRLNLSFQVLSCAKTSEQQISIARVTCQLCSMHKSAYWSHDTCTSRGAAESVLSHPRSADSVSAKIHLNTPKPAGTLTNNEPFSLFALN